MCGARPCRHIWEKVWRMLVWTADNEAHLGDWFCKVDEDTYILPENLKAFVAMMGWDPRDNYYFGHKLYNRLCNNIDAPFTRILHLLYSLALTLVPLPFFFFFFPP